MTKQHRGVILHAALTRIDSFECVWIFVEVREHEGTLYKACSPHTLKNAKIDPPFLTLIISLQGSVFNEFLDVQNPQEKNLRSSPSLPMLRSGTKHINWEKGAKSGKSPCHTSGSADIVRAGSSMDCPMSNAYGNEVSAFPLEYPCWHQRMNTGKCEKCVNLDINLDISGLTDIPWSK